MEELLVRKATPEDKNFILATWLNSFRKSSHVANKVRDFIYYEWHQKTIERIMGRHGAETLVAVWPEDEEIIMGYLVYEKRQPPLIHFCYVKKSFRKEGVMNALMKAAEISLEKETYFTHYTFSCEWLTQKYTKMVYCPYFI